MQEHGFKKYKHKESGEIVDGKINDNMGLIKPTVQFMINTMWIFKNRRHLAINQALLAKMLENPDGNFVKVFSLATFNEQYEPIE